MFSASTTQTPGAHASSARFTGLSRALRHLVRARVVHFLLLGGIIFAFSRHRAQDPYSLALSSAELSALRPASDRTAALRERARARAIEDAVLVAEARRLGMDQDEIVRARLVQKQLFLAEELAGASRAPTEQELRAYYEAHRDEQRLAASCVFTHVFAKTQRAAADLLEPVRNWAETATDADVPPFGDAFPLSRHVRSSAASLAQGFGAEFASAIARAPLGRWVGPLRSQYGFHLVKLQTYAPARPATFEEVRSQLQLRVLIERREHAVAAYLRGLLARYHISIDGEPVAPHEPLPRTAPRAADSVEDG